MTLPSAKFIFSPGWLKRSEGSHSTNLWPIAKFLAAMLIVVPLTADAQQIQVGSKRFTESYVLGEIGKRLLEDAGFSVEHKQGMGGTIIVWRR